MMLLEEILLLLLRQLCPGRRLTELSMSMSLLTLLMGRTTADDVVLVFDRHALGHVVDLVDTDEAGGELKHVVA